MNDTTRRHMCDVYDLQVHRTFSLLKLLQTGVYILIISNGVLIE